MVIVSFKLKNSKCWPCLSYIKHTIRRIYGKLLYIYILYIDHNEQAVYDTFMMYVQGPNVMYQWERRSSVVYLIKQLFYKESLLSEAICYNSVKFKGELVCRGISIVSLMLYTVAYINYQEARRSQTFFFEISWNSR
jgi:hypothetical protein